MGGWDAEEVQRPNPINNAPRSVKRINFLMVRVQMSEGFPQNSKAWTMRQACKRGLEGAWRESPGEITASTWEGHLYLQNGWSSTCMFSRSWLLGLIRKTTNLQESRARGRVFEQPKLLPTESLPSYAVDASYALLRRLVCKWISVSNDIHVKWKLQSPS